MIAETELLLCEDDAARWSVAITRETIERILKEESEDKGDMLALWMFYAYTCRWQETNQARATVAYAAKGLGWSEARVKKARTALKALLLIEDAQGRNAEGKVSGWYVRVRHLVKGVKIHPSENTTGGESDPKCSRTLNGNALGLSTNTGREPKDLFPQEPPRPPARPERPQLTPELMERVGALKGRRADSRWSDKEKKTLRDLLPIPEDELHSLERYYRAKIPKDSDIRRRDLGTLLNNWSTEVDRARNFKEHSCF